MSKYFLSNDNYEDVLKTFNKAIKMSLSYKISDDICASKLEDVDQYLSESIPKYGTEMDDLLSYFSENILKHCTNFASKNFMGFPDSGISIASMVGAILSELLQQNLINQSFCSPSATFTEFDVINWLREILGYDTKTIEEITDIGGIVTVGGTMSNTVAMLLARERFKIKKDTAISEECVFLIPDNINHYSIKSSLFWIGCNCSIVYVPTINYRMNLKELERILKENENKVIGLVAYAGDSRTMTIDNLYEIQKMAREFDEDIWLHVDACHGFSLAFSEELKHKLHGINLFDSVSVDPHKVMCCPYTISALLLKKADDFKMIETASDLITKEKFALGQITPFMGSKNWSSLKLWFMIKHMGKEEIGLMIEERHYLAKYLGDLLEASDRLLLVNEIEINSVMFMYEVEGSLEKLNEVNRKIYKKIKEEGKYYLHQFPIKDEMGNVASNQIIYPLRFMCGNPNTTKEDIDNMVSYIIAVGEEVEKRDKNAER